jgi:hypothetical protein
MIGFTWAKDWSYGGRRLCRLLVLLIAVGHMPLAGCGRTTVVYVPVYQPVPPRPVVVIPGVPPGPGGFPPPMGPVPGMTPMMAQPMAQPGAAPMAQPGAAPPMGTPPGVAMAGKVEGTPLIGADSNRRPILILR